MLWPMFFLTLAFCGTAVLGVLAVRVGLEVRRLSRAVGDSSERITLAAEDLERAAGAHAASASRTADVPGLRRERDGASGRSRTGER